MNWKTIKQINTNPSLMIRTNLRLLNSIKNGLIVSCQAEDTSPFNTPETLNKFAQAAENAGAKAIRSEGIVKTKKIIETVNIPVIGLVKSNFPDGYVKITGSFKNVEELIKINCTIIAIDGTMRKRERLSGPEFIHRIKSEFKCCIIADVSTFDEGLACYEAGADCIATTLSGYTPETKKLQVPTTPDYKLLKSLLTLPVPIIAEGRYRSPMQAKKAIEMGAWAVTVGTAITRPAIITSWFVEKLTNR